ncbi:FG-GAP-like repeat-containing protein [Oscillatoria sp. CS-180]|uniref:rhamnogalacturonan lyase family protein n=1 Tax=Oscillatoria sp. CS-180 TaxID=3021720 RepID=UPI00232F73BB|nr:FG-GAP-like repeat-containing protein [Oscillatoria sp. CS-180]MDB9529213.1 FG-GAP-like repeat-containing protein [Oscillatoria sp. CS-180]
MAYFQFNPFRCSLGLSAIAYAIFLGGCSTVSFSRELATTVDGDSLTAMPPPNVTINRIALDLPDAFAKEGGLIATDVNGDRQLDIVVTQPGRVAAYSLTDGKLWQRETDIWLTGQTESEGLPGLHAPGIQAADVDGDGNTDLLYVAANNRLEILDGTTGEVKARLDLPAVQSLHNQWEHAVVANFTDKGDGELLLQASRETNSDSYVRDSIQAAFAISDLLSVESAAEPLWRTNDFVSLSHGSAKVFDLDGDGKDEVVGAMVLGPDGNELYNPGLENTDFPHIDAIAVDDIDPERPGLEIVIPEERGDLRVILFDEQGTVWTSGHRRRAEDYNGDKVAIGDFDPARAGLEMWFRGDESKHFTALDAAGEVIASYKFRDHRPDNWTEKGFEVITPIRWSGGDQDYIVAKERHEAGDVGIFDPLTGQLVAQFPNRTERLYVADVVGDWREEIIVLSNAELIIYQNQQSNPNPDRQSLWNDPLYRRQKMTWNYYSP